MTIKKKHITYIILLAAVLFVGGYLYLNANSLIIRTTEKIASNALGVPVNIGSIHLSLANKSVSLNTLKIGNPPGYQQPHIITADSISVGLNTASQKLIDFKDIKVNDVHVYFELTPQGSNLMDLKKLSTSKKQTSSAGSETIRVIVQKMTIGASVIHPSVALIGKEIPAIKMPAVNISGIGQKNGGANAADVIVQVLNKYLSSAQQTISTSGVIPQIPNIGNVNKTLDDAKGKLKNLF